MTADRTPDELCQRYADGALAREQLVEELAQYPYATMPMTDGYDWLTVDPPGTWSEVSRAIDQGLIEEDVYEEVFNRRHPGRPQTS